MVYERDTIEHKKRQNEIIKKLVEEAINGETKMDTLEEHGNYLWCPEAEAMYFLSIRKFFETSIAHRVMERNQDIFELESSKKIKVLNR